ncbi:MAG: hypothetical protein EBY18_01405 [Alphaproteobacteria bacterium]|nr:hypothetical protein [Alphaproteobacteria bacterium]
MATKKVTAKRKNAGGGGKITPKLEFFDRGDVPDKIGRLLNASQMVPERFRGTDRFLDIVSWNIRWFDHQDDRRVEAITEVMAAINGDIFVLTEIAEDGALDAVVEALKDRNVGFYSAHYGTTGGQQRVVLLWDRDWVRLKRNPAELFTDNPLTVAEDGRKHEIFPRRPLWGYFEALPDRPGREGFDFELVGVHLKSQMPPKGYSGRGGVRQREEAARRLADWIDSPAEHFDQDVLIFGDWNAVPDESEWKVFEEMEKDKKVSFRSINPKDEITHIARLNKSGPAGTRLDMHLITNSRDATKAAKDKGVVIQWRLFDHLESLSTPDRQLLFKAMKMNFSDHLPVVSRFYFTTGR